MHQWAAHEVIRLLVSLLGLHLLLLWLVDFIDCNLKHLNLTLNVQQSITFSFLGWWLHLCHNLGLDTRHTRLKPTWSWLKPTWSCCLLSGCVLTAHVRQTWCTWSEFLFESFVSSSCITALITWPASSKDTMFLWREGRGSDSTLATIRGKPSAFPFMLSWCAQTTPRSWSKGARCPTHRPPHAGSVSLVQNTDRVTSCPELAAVCARWWQHAVWVFTWSGPSVVGHVRDALSLHVLLDLGSLSQDCILSSSEESANFTLWWIGNELLYKGWSSEEFVTGWLVSRWSGFLKQKLWVEKLFF